MSAAADVDRIFLGRVLGVLRAKADVDQTLIAKRVGVSQSAVSRYGRGACVPNAIQFAALVSAIGETPERVYTLVELAKCIAESVTRATFGKSTRSWRDVAMDVGEDGVAGLADFCIAVAMFKDKK